jgi:hypothetical protein
MTDTSKPQIAPAPVSTTQLNEQFKRITYKTVCEKIAAFLTERGTPTTGVEVWEMSPTGEIWPIHDLYHKCVSEGMEPVPSHIALIKSVPLLPPEE